jgi:hypothetical protein
VHKQVASIRVKNDEAEVCSIIEKLEFPSLPLGEALDLADHMLGIGAIFKLSMLRELVSTIHLINHIFSSLWISQSLSWNKHWWRWPSSLVLQIGDLPLMCWITHRGIISCLLDSRTRVWRAIHVNLLLLRMRAHFIIALLGRHAMI